MKWWNDYDMIWGKGHLYVPFQKVILSFLPGGQSICFHAVLSDSHCCVLLKWVKGEWRLLSAWLVLAVIIASSNLINLISSPPTPFSHQYINVKSHGCSCPNMSLLLLVVLMVNCSGLNHCSSHRQSSIDKLMACSFGNCSLFVCNSRIF